MCLLHRRIGLEKKPYMDRDVILSYRIDKGITLNSQFRPIVECICSDFLLDQLFAQLPEFKAESRVAGLRALLAQLALQYGQLEFLLRY